MVFDPLKSKKEHGRLRFQELQNRKNRIGSRHTRKIEKFSDRFNTIFKFFFQSYRKGILVFAGEAVDVKFDLNSFCARGSFRRFDDGQFKLKDIVCIDPNILKSVIIAKKSWGLHLKMWSEAIAEGTFLKNEILAIFENEQIEIPESFMIEFENLIYKARVKYNSNAR